MLSVIDLIACSEQAMPSTAAQTSFDRNGNLDGVTSERGGGGRVAVLGSIRPNESSGKAFKDACEHGEMGKRDGSTCPERRPLA